MLKQEQVYEHLVDPLLGGGETLNVSPTSSSGTPAVERSGGSVVGAGVVDRVRVTAFANDPGTGEHRPHGPAS